MKIVQTWVVVSFSMLLLFAGSYPALGAKVELDGEVYDVRFFDSDKTGIEHDKRKGSLIEYIAQPESGKRLSSREAAKLMATSDVLTECEHLGKGGYVAALQEMKISSKLGGDVFAESEYVIDVAVPAVSKVLANHKEMSPSAMVGIGMDALSDAAKTTSEVAAMQYGIAIGRQYMDEAIRSVGVVQDYMARIDAGEVLGKEEIDAMHEAAVLAKKLGLAGAQISKISSTLGREGYGDVLKEHGANLIKLADGLVKDVLMDEALGAVADTSLYKKAAKHMRRLTGYDKVVHTFASWGLSDAVVKKLLHDDALIKLPLFFRGMYKNIDDLKGAFGEKEPLSVMLEKQQAELYAMGITSPLDNPALLNYYRAIIEGESDAAIEERWQAVFASGGNETGGGGGLERDNEINKRYAEHDVGSSGSSSSKARAGDISINSRVDDVNVSTKSRRGKTDSLIHSVELKGDASVKNVNIDSRVDDVVIENTSRRGDVDVSIQSIKGDGRGSMADVSIHSTIDDVTVINRSNREDVEVNIFSVESGRSGRSKDVSVSGNIGDVTVVVDDDDDESSSNIGSVKLR